MSDPEQGRTTRVFLRAAELQGEDRDRFLQEACAGDPALRAEVESLLRDDLPSGALAGAVQLESDEPSAIGPYRILARLGEGGMGVVYVADQTEPVRRRVAVKLIKVGMDTKEVIARFEGERQALALMDHPHVARILDAGSTAEGRPYFVMECVQGLPITEHCDRHRLTTAERLKLFACVCDGVQHAHQKGLIHRDLKPSNVLVAIQDRQAVPKIIDFGVAKATAQKLTERTIYTKLGLMIGTPEYMSPEQADLTVEDVDTRTDVYSLGVMLYVLLAGALPFEPAELRRAGLDELRRRVRDDDPPTPSARLATLGGDRVAEVARARKTEPRRLAVQLRGDLDWIVMKALQKDRGDRYGSPSELAADIRRHLRNEAVEAGPPGGLYRLRKFVRRHRLAVGLALASAAALVAFAVREREQARRIAREAETSQRVTEFLLDIFANADSKRNLGRPVTARELLDRGAESLNTGLEDEPELKARFLTIAANLYHRLGHFDRAETSHREALVIRERTLGGDAPETLDSCENLAGCLRDLGRFSAAIPYFQRVLETRAERLPAGHPDLLRVRHELGVLYSRSGDRKRAEPMFRRILAAQAGRPGEDDGQLLETLNALGWLLIQEQRLDEAEPLLRRAVDGYRRLRGPLHANTLQSKANLAYLYDLQGRAEDARPLMTEFLEACDELVRAPGDPYVRAQCALRFLNCVPEDLRQPVKALRLLVEAAEMTGYRDPRVLNLLAMAQARNGNAVEAVRLQVLALDNLSDEEPEETRRIWEENLRGYRSALQSPIR